MGPGSGMFLTLNQESGMEKFGSGIRDKHPGSATLPMPMPVCPSVWTGILMLTFCVTNIVRFLGETLKTHISICILSQCRAGSWEHSMGFHTDLALDPT